MRLKDSFSRAGFVLVIILFSTASQVVAETQAALIEELVAQGDLQAAMILTDQQLAADSDNVSLLFLKGLIHTRSNELDQARNIFIRLTQDHPELPEPFNNLAVIYAAQGDFNNARAALQQAINTHPSYATAHENLGDIYAKMASKAYNQALELDEENETAREKLLLVNDLFPQQGAGVEQTDNKRQAELEQARAEIAELESTLSELRLQSRKTLESNRALQEELKLVSDVSDSESAKSRQQLGELSEALKQSQDELVQTRQRLAEALKQSQDELAQTQQRLAELEQQQVVIRTAQATIQPADPGQEQAVRQGRLAAQQAVIQAVKDWAASWSRQDITGYLTSYSETFAPQGTTRQDWMKQRKARIESPGYISVEILEPAVSLVSEAEARVTFFQEYKSDTYSDRVFKTLFMTKQSGRWFIEEELAN
jgi:DNA repair exonuclease SbcCD ATPase subunit